MFIVLHATGVAGEKKDARTHCLCVARLVTFPADAVSLTIRLEQFEDVDIPTFWDMPVTIDGLYDRHQYGLEFGEALFTKLRDTVYGRLASQSVLSTVQRGIPDPLVPYQPEDFYYLRFKPFSRLAVAREAFGEITDRLPEEPNMFPKSFITTRDTLTHRHIHVADVDEHSPARADSFVYEAVNAVMPYNDCCFWKRVQTGRPALFQREWLQHFPAQVAHIDDVHIVYGGTCE